MQESKIFVPNLENYACVVIRNNSTMRAYENMPQRNSSSDYTDYYFTSNYVYTKGTESWTNYSTLPVCLTSDQITDEVYYRNDFDSILIIFMILCIFCFVFPWKIFTRIFRKWSF